MFLLFFLMEVLEMIDNLPSVLRLLLSFGTMSFVSSVLVVCLVLSLKAFHFTWLPMVSSWRLSALMVCRLKLLLALSSLMKTFPYRRFLTT